MNRISSYLIITLVLLAFSFLANIYLAISLRTVEKQFDVVVKVAKEALAIGTDLWIKAETCEGSTGEKTDKYLQKPRPEVLPKTSPKVQG